MSLMDRRQLVIFAAALAAAVPHGAGASTDEKKKGGGLTFIQLNTITATVVRADGRRGVLTLETGIDVPDEKLRQHADLVAPRLRAAFVQVLQTYAAGISPSTPPNADFVAAELQRETDRILGKKGARVLLGTMLMN
jgi:hypothetical protein